MDFLVEFFSELLFDTAVSGAVSAAGSRRLPGTVRKYRILREKVRKTSVEGEKKGE